MHVFRPGWQALTQCPLEEVGAHHWTTLNDELLHMKERVLPGDWFDVKYEALIGDPVSFFAPVSTNGGPLAQFGRWYSRWKATS